MWPTCGSSVLRRDILKNAPNITFTKSNPNPAPAPTHMNFARLCSVGYVRNHTRGFYPGYYPTKNFCKLCRTFIPVPGSYVSSVLHTHTRTSCEFCNTCVPVPGTCVSSVRSPYPCPEIQHPGNTRGDRCSFRISTKSAFYAFCSFSSKRYIISITSK